MAKACLYTPRKISDSSFGLCKELIVKLHSRLKHRGDGWLLQVIKGGVNKGMTQLDQEGAEKEKKTLLYIKQEKIESILRTKIKK